MTNPTRVRRKPEPAHAKKGTGLPAPFDVSRTIPFNIEVLRPLKAEYVIDSNSNIDLDDVGELIAQNKRDISHELRKSLGDSLPDYAGLTEELLQNINLLRRDSDLDVHSITTFICLLDGIMQYGVRAVGTRTYVPDRGHPFLKIMQPGEANTFFKRLCGHRLTVAVREGSTPYEFFVTSPDVYGQDGAIDPIYSATPEGAVYGYLLAMLDYLYADTSNYLRITHGSRSYRLTDVMAIFDAMYEDSVATASADDLEEE